MNFSSARLLCLVAVSTVTLTGIRALAADLDREFEFASGLVKLGFPDYAQRVVDDIVRLNPDQKGRGDIVRAEGLISQRKFADAEKILQDMGSDPKADAIRLALANGYYHTGDIEKARNLYNSFFGRFKEAPQDADLIRFYRDAAYTYGQMLEAAGDIPGSIDAYEKVLSTKPEREIARRIMSDQANLFIRAAKAASGGARDDYLKKAEKLCNDLFWGGVDLWFGQGVISLANSQLLKGDRAGAMKTLQYYNDILTQLDDLLKEQNMLSQSPMAGVRFMKGQLLNEDAQASRGDQAKRDETIKLYGQALGEFYNVFVKYGDSDWGPEAGIKANEIKLILERDFGKTVNIDLGGLQDKAVQTQFRIADNLFRQKKYGEAIPEYLKGINLFPEADASVGALGALAQCYAELGDTLMVKAVTGYIAERFPTKDRGANALLALGKVYFDKKDESMYVNVYETYLTGYPKHDRAGAILFTLGGLKKQAGDEAASKAYYERIVQNYPQDQFYPKALTQLAWTYYKAGEYANALVGFQNIVTSSPPSPEVVQAQFNLGDCYVRVEKYPEAVAAFETLIGWLAPKDNPYASTADGREKNKKYLELAVYHRANSYTRIKTPADQVPTYRDRAMRGFDQFLALFPQSDLAPKALSGKGRVQLELGQVDAANTTFDDLAKRFPTSQEGQNALYALASSAIEIGQFDQARSALQKMLANAATFKPDEFVRVGQLFLDKALYTEALEAFGQVLKPGGTQERALVERSLYGAAQSAYKLQKYDEAVGFVSQLMEKFPNSGLFYEAKFILGESNRETGRTKEAMEALSDVFRYATDAVLINRASVELGLIQAKAGDNKAALASFQRVALLADPDKEALRPLIERAIVESVKVAESLQEWQSVQEYCDQYLSIFPKGASVEDMRSRKAAARTKTTSSAPAQSGVESKP